MGRHRCRLNMLEGCSKPCQWCDVGETSQRFGSLRLDMLGAFLLASCRKSVQDQDLYSAVCFAFKAYCIKL
jgi:hypothetical protein